MKETVQAYKESRGKQIALLPDKLCSNTVLRQMIKGRTRGKEQHRKGAPGVSLMERVHCQ